MEFLKWQQEQEKQERSIYITQLIKDKKVNNIIIQLEKDNLISQWEKNIRECKSKHEDINLLKFAQNKNQLDEFILGLQSNIIQLLIVVNIIYLNC